MRERLSDCFCCATQEVPAVTIEPESIRCQQKSGLFSVLPAKCDRFNAFGDLAVLQLGHRTGSQKRVQEPIAKWPGGCSALLVPDPFSATRVARFTTQDSHDPLQLPQQSPRGNRPDQVCVRGGSRTCVSASSQAFAEHHDDRVAVNSRAAGRYAGRSHQCTERCVYRIVGKPDSIF